MFAELPSVVEAGKGSEEKREREGEGRRRGEERRGQNGERMGWARLTDSGTVEEALGMRELGEEAQHALWSRWYNYYIEK